MSSEVRQFLRRETQALHDRVDDIYSRFDLHHCEGAAGFLRAHYAVIAGIENTGLYQVWPFPLQRPPRLQPLIEKDLHTLSAQTPPISALAEPTAPALMGLTYVVAGSRFGSKVIMKEWRGAASAIVRAADMYISFDGFAEFWLDYLEYLDLVGQTATAREHILDGARSGFILFENAALAELSTE